MSATLASPACGELPRHVARVLLGDAEAERAHRAGIKHDPLDRLQKLGDAKVVVGQQVAELVERVAAAPPRDLAEVGSVRDAEVLERDEEALVDRLPEPQLDGDPLVEPLGDVLAVQALGRRGQPQ